MTGPIPLSAVRRRSRRARIQEYAARQDSVVSRQQLRSLGISDGEVAANLAAGRWRRLGQHSICMHTGPLPDRAQWWAAVFEGGPRAFLDGESALVAAGLEHYEPRAVRVSVPRGARIRGVPECSFPVDIRQTRRWDPIDLHDGAGPPRARTEVAAIRAALWARTDKQAAYLLTLCVQQRLTTAQALGEEMLRIRRDRRRAFLHAVLLDLLGGVRSLGELEFARECRRRGLPEPTRQMVRRAPNGTYFLDVYFEEWGVVVEVDGIHHTWATQVIGDALRQNDITLQRDIVLRLPLLALRIAPDEFFAQIERALVARGYPTRHIA